jgi:RNA polymerase sigma-70 factor, ECF subfamily
VSLGLESAINMRNIEEEIAQWKRRLDSPDGVWDETILEKALHGDTEAVNKLIERSGGRIAKIINCRLGRAKVRDKEDLYQEALVQVFDGIHQGELKAESEASFIVWLVLLVTRTLADWLTRETHRKRESEYDDQLTPFPGIGMDYVRAAVSGKEDKLFVQSALNQLEERERTIVVLCFYEEMSTREAAEILDISATQAERLRRVALNRLEKILKKTGFAEDQQQSRR